MVRRAKNRRAAAISGFEARFWLRAGMEKFSGQTGENAGQNMTKPGEVDIENDGKGMEQSSKSAGRMMFAS